MVALLALRCAISCTLLPVLAWLPRVRDSFAQVVRFAAAAVALPSIGPFFARFESFACWFDLQRVTSPTKAYPLRFCMGWHAWHVHVALHVCLVRHTSCAGSYLRHLCAACAPSPNV